MRNYCQQNETQSIFKLIKIMKEYLKLTVDPTDENLISVVDELPLWSAPFGLRLLDVVHMRKNMKALDLGCGSGFPLIELSQRLGQTSLVCGIDPWEEALHRVRKKLRVFKIKNVNIFKAQAEFMPFEDECFDLIVSNNGINNVQDISLTLNECHRVSTANAQLVFTLNTEKTMIEFYSVFQHVLEEEKLGNEIRKMKNHIYAKRKPVQEIIELSEDAGFVVNDIIHDSFEMRFVDGSAMLNHNLIKYWFLAHWKEIVNQQDLSRIFGRVESRLNENSEANGHFTLTIPFVAFDCHKK